MKKSKKQRKKEERKAIIARNCVTRSMTEEEWKEINDFYDCHMHMRYFFKDWVNLSGEEKEAAMKKAGYG